MKLGRDRLFVFMGAVLAMLLVVLAMGYDIPSWVRWLSLGFGLWMIILIVSASRTVRRELWESKSALKRARNQRDEMKRYFHALMDTLPTWIYFKDRESKFLQVNKALADYSGMTPEEMIGKSDADFLEPESANKNRQDEIQILASGEGRERFIEKENLPGGGDAWVLTSKSPLRDHRGRIIGTFGVSSNVTEMVEAKNALEKEHNTLRTLLDSIPDSIYIRDVEGEYIIANKAFAEFAGVPSPADVIGLTPYDFYPNDIAARYLKEDIRVINTGETLANHAHSVENAKGIKRYVITTKVPVSDQGGNVFGILGINRDVTRQEQAREALRQTEHRMQEIVDNSPSPMYAKAVSGEYLMVNRRFEELFSLKVGDIVGKTDSDIFSDTQKVKALREKDILVATSGQPVQFDEVLKLDDGGHAYVSTKFPMRNLAGEIYAVGGISTDITDRKHAEEKLKNLNQELIKTHENLTSAHEQLIQAEKMESVGRLAAGVAHEVKNPLAMISMGLEHLVHRLPENDTQGKETIDRMQNGIERAKKIVRGLVDYSSDRKLEFQSHDPNQLVSNSLDLVGYQLKKHGVIIDFKPGEDLPNVHVDQTKIEQVLVNLFMNAMHAMETEGTLTIHIDQITLKDVKHDQGSRLRERRRNGDRLIRIYVKDTGKGIPVNVLNKIFDPFFTTKATGIGTGLGLTVSKKIAELHGGDLSLTNRNHSSGACAVLTLKVI